MKKITILLLVFSLCSLFSYGQYLTEGFENTVPPTGWTLTQVNTAETWITSPNAHSGTAAAEVNYDDALNSQNETLTTPVLDLSAATNPRLVFWFSMSYFWAIDPNNNYDFTVSLTDGTTETVIWQEADFGVFESFTYYKVELNLAAYAGQSNVQVLFNYSGLDGAALYLDDVLVEETPTCPAPENIVATPSFTTANFTWNAVTEALLGYEWVVMVTGEAPDAGTAIDSGATASGELTANATLLNEATDYDFYVRSVCSTTDTGNWAPVIGFRTLAPAPNCASTPFPADGAVDVATGDITFSWEAPTTGPTPTSYNLYAGETPSGDDYGLIGNFTETTAELTLSGYDLELYWIIKPVNETTEAEGCPVWSFTTGPAPTGAVCENAIVVSSLPYNTTDNTALYGDDYERTDVPDISTAQYTDGTGSTYYITGDDVVYQFTPDADGTYNFNLSETLDDWIGFWLFEGCPFTSVVAYHTATSGTTRSLPAINLTAGTTYYVVISSWPAPQSTAYTLDITVESLSTNEFQQANGFTYYPNPVTNLLTVEGTQTIQSLSVFNLLGQAVLRATPNEVYHKLDMSNLQSGVYVVKINTASGTETLRVIKN
ncbi:T9SS type A sorting domain-containing protein [Bizionia sediminis]|uniref:T9SS type A sorting domain-containing protein n=1 Tax=Bizionia sediminis TaxID=1737064 RepID=A0ABW5KUL6_9FLAO